MSVSDRSETVLVVDDDLFVRQALRDLLEAERLTVSTAANGAEAMAHAAHHRPNLVVLDLNLPGFSGETLSAVLHAHFGGAVPMVIISGDPCAHERVYGLPATVLLRKPLHPDEFVAVVFAILQRAATRADRATSTT